MVLFHNPSKNTAYNYKLQYWRRIYSTPTVYTPLSDGLIDTHTDCQLCDIFASSLHIPTLSLR